MFVFLNVNFMVIVKLRIESPASISTKESDPRLYPGPAASITTCPIGVGLMGSHGQGQIGEKLRKVKLAWVIERIYRFPVNGSRLQKYFRFEVNKLPCGQLSLHLLDLLKHLSNSAFLDCCHCTFNVV